MTVVEELVLKALASCRTAALGGHVLVCNHCGEMQVSYNSCRNRHCPKCQGAARAAWLEARCDDLLAVPYYHVVFTLPATLAPLALQNKRLLYGLLFQCSSATLLETAANPKHLGAGIGFLSVLHTWGQNLQHHPHVHCVVPGGGLSPDGTSWIDCPQNFFLPVRVLSRLFQGKYLAYLREAYEAKQLSLHGSLAEWNDPQRFRQLLAKAYNEDWVVYAKPPFGGPEQVLKYLARYTYRVAIANDRLESLEDGRVTFRWKDYRNKGQWGKMTLTAEEFIRRFLMHVLPSGFMRIRYYGFLGNRYRRDNLDLCRRLLLPRVVKVPLAGNPTAEEKQLRSGSLCPTCRQGQLLLTERPRPRLKDILASWPFDSS